MFLRFSTIYRTPETYPTRKEKQYRGEMVLQRRSELQKTTGLVQGEGVEAEHQK